MLASLNITKFEPYCAAAKSVQAISSFKKKDKIDVKGPEIFL